MTLRKDYCWKRVGWRWEVWAHDLDRYGHPVFSRRVIPLRFWTWRQAAVVSNAIFEAYNDGRSAQRMPSPFPPSDPLPPMPIGDK